MSINVKNVGQVSFGAGSIQKTIGKKLSKNAKSGIAAGEHFAKNAANVAKMTAQDIAKEEAWIDRLDMDFKFCELF